jgi:hypothetical protein
VNRLKWIPLLFLVACATDSPPATYERGTFRPPPPALRPGHGLPTYEPHPEVVPQVQPQPKQAPVPHTPQTVREDTIWASGTPKRHGGPIMFLDVNIRIPEVATEEELGYAETCKWALSGVLAANGKALERELLDAMYDEYRGCAILQMWDYCMRVDWERNRDKWEISERLRGKVVGPFENQCREKWRKLGEFRLRFESAMRKWMHGTKEETRH